MKKNFILAASVISIGLLGACSQTEKSEDTKVSADVEEKTEVVDPKAWKDVTKEYTEDGFQSVKEMISYYNDAFQGGVKDDNELQIKEDGFPVEYYYYLEALSLDTELTTHIQVEGEFIERDFGNLLALSYIIQEEQFKVLDEVTLPEGTDKSEAKKYWNPPTERMKQAITYMKYLLNDLDIVINESKGELVGYSYQAGGKKNDELEEFIKDSIQTY
jgi:hypothetical protein